MQEFTTLLPERCCKMNAHVSADVDVFHFLTLALSTVIDNVEVLEVSTDVICEIDAMGRVAACCSPMGGVILQRLYSRQTQAVKIPVVGVFIHWSVGLERGRLENGKFAMRIAEGHH